MQTYDVYCLKDWFIDPPSSGGLMQTYDVYCLKDWVVDLWQSNIVARPGPKTLAAAVLEIASSEQTVSLKYYMCITWFKHFHYVMGT
jgi:hypothetical protein